MNRPLEDYRTWTALVTPLTGTGAVDFQALTRLLRVQETAGNGVLLLGSTGEGANLTQADREAVIQHACGLHLNVPLMAGVGGLQLEETLAWLDFCQQQPLDAYLMVTPLYAKPGAAGQARWFRALLDHVDRPCMLYNVPSRTGCSLSLDALEQLAGHPNFRAVKEASGSLRAFAEYVRRLPGILIYSGDDALMPQQSMLGAHGLVSVMSNAWPKATAEYVRSALDHSLADPMRWQVAAESLFVAANPVPVKHLLHLKGWIASDQVRLPLDRTDLTNPQPLIEADRSMTVFEEEAA
ncbi:MAG: 4-hydroxy-tetrahydrodipicolinate synthase [Acidobacteriota bacterium]|nr:4-hydroxy-tetrahydrodipicolinate synthase [Acidobacteriota bacterium]